MVQTIFTTTALLAALVAISSPALGRSLEYECDTGSEHFSLLKTAPDSSDGHVKGSMTVNEMYFSKSYATLGSVTISGPANSWSVRLSMSGIAKASKSILTGELRIKTDDKTEAVQLSTFNVGQSIPFSLQVKADGHGQAMLGDHTLPMSISASGPFAAWASCSTGDVLFSSLDLGDLFLAVVPGAVLGTEKGGAIWRKSQHRETPCAASVRELVSASLICCTLVSALFGLPDTKLDLDLLPVRW
jgi:hypothetical protein